MNTVDIISKIIAEETGNQNINITIPLAKQINSIDLIYLIMEIEERFWLDIDDNLVNNNCTIAELATFIDGELLNQIP